MKLIDLNLSDNRQTGSVQLEIGNLDSLQNLLVGLGEILPGGEMLINCFKIFPSKTGTKVDGKKNNIVLILGALCVFL